MGTSQAAVTPRREYRLYNANAVAVATFFCSPLAGTILMAVNFRRLGQARKGTQAIALGAAGCAVSLLLKWNWDSVAATVCGIALAVVFFLCTWQIALEVQGEAIDEHVAAGGQLGSKWTAMLVGIVTLGALYGVVCAVLFSVQDRKVMFGANDAVVYSGLATRGDAKALGDELKKQKYFEGQGATVLFKKTMMTRTISFVVEGGTWNQTGVMVSFDEMVRAAAPKLGGFPVEVELLDSEKTVEATSTVGEVCFGHKECLYYEGTATKDEAEELADRLKERGFSRREAASVMLIKQNGEGTTLQFVVDDGVWTDPQKVSAFEAIVREAGPVVGGMPIQMRLMDGRGDVKTDDLVE